MAESTCIFCRIAAGELPAELLYEDEQAVAFRDTHPQAPTHVLVIPRRHLNSLAASQAADRELLGHLLRVVVEVAERLGIGTRGWRTVINTGDDGGQTVHHLHLHLLGGRFCRWPPG